MSEGHEMREIEDMRVTCPQCKELTATHSRAASKEPVSSAYARCRNEKCEKFDRVFVTQISFSHWVDVKVAAVQMSLDMMLDMLPEEARKEFLASKSEQINAA